MTRIRLRLAWLLSSLLAMSALACAPARTGQEIASFQRELDVELARALEPRAGFGLEAACHSAPIVWMHFLADGKRWRLMSVDGRGQVGIWTKRGLQQTWLLDADEHAWVRQVVERQGLSEDADWLRARVRVPAPLLIVVTEPSGFFEPPTLGGDVGDIAPRDRHRWVGVHDRRREVPRRIAASGRWYAVGDNAGTLTVARVAARRPSSKWVSPGCRKVH